ncbi:MAG: oligopeptide ABC transporter oligopeptide-binding protein [Hyphomicrobiales bacterium]|nr:MAG: oligopeptide ABC transporter oligopeptide-binding protein [Hyphomicrobiales bacterium]
MKLKLSTSILALCLSVSAAQAYDLTIAVAHLPNTLDPVMENSNVSQRIIYNLFDTLVKVDYRDGGKLVSGLADSWEIIDAKTIEFTLKKGVHFHDGTEMTAKDILFTFSPLRLGHDNVAIGGSGTVVSKPFIGGIEKVEAIDEYTVRISMKDDDALIIHRFANYPSQIVSKSAFEAAGSYEEFALHIVGTGPYKFSNLTLDDHVIIEKFDNYYGDNKAAADKVTFTVVPEISTRIAGLRAGQFDMITEVTPDHIEEIDKAENASIAGGPILNIRGLVYDSTNEIIGDPRIREALNLAIDRETLAQALYQNHTSVPHGWQMQVFGKMYLADRPIPEFNIEKAQKLLKEAGYNGEEIVYRTQNSYYTSQIETAQILVAMWKKAGLNVKLAVKENWGQVTEDNETRHIFDASFTAYYPDPMGQFWRRFGPTGGWAQNDVYINTEEMIVLGKTLATETDTAIRRDVFTTMLDKFETNPRGAVLHELTQIYGVRKGLTYSPLSTSYMDFTTAGVSVEK